MPGLGNPEKNCSTCDACGPLSYYCKDRKTKVETPTLMHCSEWKPWKQEAESGPVESTNPIPCPYPLDDPTINCLHCDILCQGKVAWFDKIRDGLQQEKRYFRKEPEQKQKEAQVQKCLVAKEKGWRRGYMMAELHLMCDAASQLLPDRKPQWELLRNTLEDTLKALWARNDQQEKETKNGN